jgi:hypothetical protein
MGPLRIRLDWCRKVGEFVGSEACLCGADVSMTRPSPPGVGRGSVAGSPMTGRRVRAGCGRVLCFLKSRRFGESSSPDTSCPKGAGRAMMMERDCTCAVVVILRRVKWRCPKFESGRGTRQTLAHGLGRRSQVTMLRRWNRGLLEACWTSQSHQWAGGCVLGARVLAMDSSSEGFSRVSCRRGVISNDEKLGGRWYMEGQMVRLQGPLLCRRLDSRLCPTARKGRRLGGGRMERPCVAERKYRIRGR